MWSLQNKGANMKHIVNGECLKTYFISHHLIQQNLYSVNELFMEGPLTADIFSHKFMSQRAQYLQKQYGINPQLIQEKSEDLIEITLFDNESVTLWFDEDVYCQINLLVLLAYFYQTKKATMLEVKLIPQQFTTIKSLQDKQIRCILNPSTEQANMIYQDILIRKQYELIMTYGELELFKKFPMLKESLVWYSKLQQNNHELIEYIESQIALPEQLLIEQLLNDYSNLGLTDMQYRNMIKKVRG